MSAKCLLILSVEMILFLMDLPMLKLIKLAKMAGVMHEFLDKLIKEGKRKLARKFNLSYRYIDDLISFSNTYSIRSTW